MFIQSVRFARPAWTPAMALNWLQSHDMKIIKDIDVTRNWLRCRLQPPKKGAQYVTKKIAGGVEIVLVV